MQLGLGRVQTQVGVLTFLSLLPVLTGEGVRWPDVILSFYFLFLALDQMLTEPRFPQAASPSPGRRTHPFQRCSREQALRAEPASPGRWRGGLEPHRLAVRPWACGLQSLGLRVGPHHP